MNSRASALFAALVFLVIGIWCSWTGWMNHKGWKTKGTLYRLGGAAAVVAGAYSASVATRR